MKLTILSKSKPKDTKQLISLLLKNRGVSDVDAFITPSDPMQLTLTDVGIDPDEVAKATLRLQVAKDKQEKIIVFGDYDCDGVCATAVIWETLHELGFKVLPVIPNRETHGYGLSAKVVDEILAAGKPDILISVDNGIVASAQWQRLKQAGIYTILTDHHEPDKQKPQVDALIHTTKLCGTTVAWMLARELDVRKAALLLDLCALATIADQMPLVGANRSFAKYGLTQLNVTKRVGLKALIEASGLEEGEITAMSVNYGIVPRINAMGRLGSALDALRALCAKNTTKVKQLVSLLSQTNSERQELTRELLDLARTRAEEWADQHIIVVEDFRFHEGVIGLIAGRLTEEFHKPSIVISLGETSSKASSRSIPGVHITNLLREVSYVLMEVGGHPLAAGLRIETIKIQEFRQAIEAKALEKIPAALLQPSISVDCELPSALMTLTVAEGLKMLEPFGQANPEPVFLFSNCQLQNHRLVGKNQQHLRLELRIGNQTVTAIGFGLAHKLPLLTGVSEINCVGRLSINLWNNKKSLQLLLKDFILATTG